jgi:hypothetical protein
LQSQPPGPKDLPHAAGAQRLGELVVACEEPGAAVDLELRRLRAREDVAGHQQVDKRLLVRTGLGERPTAVKLFLRDQLAGQQPRDKIASVVRYRKPQRLFWLCSLSRIT